MARTRIKICGIRRLADAVAAVEAGADAIGLVFAAGSPRYVSLEEARDIAMNLPGLVEAVGLFVNAPVAQVRDTAAAVGLRTVQLHGDEDAAYIAQLAPLRVIKALPYDDRFTARRSAFEAMEVPPAGLLVDAPPPRGHADGVTGGHGRSFDWEDLAREQNVSHHARSPLILAGGLTARNVARAIETVRPYAVDVSSGVESNRGVKDADMIAAFCAEVAKADRVRDAAASSDASRA